MPAERAASAQPSWLAAFRGGERAGIEAVYRDCFPAVDKAVGRILHGADRDTAVHEVFFKLITCAKVRESFTGTNFVGWLTTVARNHAVDFARRRSRETPTLDTVPDQNVEPSTPERVAGARQIVERFRQRLPSKLYPVFEKRFVEQKTQREAAEALAMPRTTLAYHEKRIRALLYKFAAELEP